MKKRRQYTSSAHSPSKGIPFTVFNVIRAHAILHAFVELANIGQHRPWYAETCDHHPLPLLVDRSICHLEIDEEHQKRYSPSAHEFLPSAHDECLNDIIPRYKGSGGTTRRVVIAQGDASTPGLRSAKMAALFINPSGRC